ncbi:hypothetical protein [Actinophytocola sp.]|uniref:hypothetical protein n=1 Tax=Actinophytocola sp. TaxID=1872138 RepID=UPI002D80FF43|nr:hypothetical protein [Actinophytocola sp.]HET9138704.1 hypothetical protein [Actinophytocola sp.]
MSRSRVAALLLTPLVLLGAAACRDDPGATPPQTNNPGGSVERQIDDLDAQLDSIERELNDN